MIRGFEPDPRGPGKGRAGALTTFAGFQLAIDGGAEGRIGYGDYIFPGTYQENEDGTEEGCRPTAPGGVNVVGRRDGAGAGGVWGDGVDGGRVLAAVVIPARGRADCYDSGGGLGSGLREVEAGTGGATGRGFAGRTVEGVPAVPELQELPPGDVRPELPEPPVGKKKPVLCPAHLEVDPCESQLEAMEYVLRQRPGRDRTIQQWQMRLMLNDSRKTFMEEKARQDKKEADRRQGEEAAKEAARLAASSQTPNPLSTSIGVQAAPDAAEEKVIELVERLLAEWPKREKT